MYLFGKKYKESPKTEIQLPSEDEIKQKIKALVPEDGKKLYKEIADTIEQEYVAQGKHLQSDLILKCIKEVETEWHPVEEVKFEVNPITE